MRCRHCGRLRGEVSTECPYCRRPLHAHDDIRDPFNTPKTGDVAICWHCFGTGIFDVCEEGDLSIRKLTPEEIDELANDSEFQAAIAAMMGSDSVAQALEKLRYTTN